MNYRCPSCRVDLAERKLSRFVIARMEIDCPGCMNRLALNLHPMEQTVVAACFAALVAIGFLAYRSQDHRLLLLALAVGAVGAFATPVLERTYLREWPRYVPAPRRFESGQERSADTGSDPAGPNRPPFPPRPAGDRGRSGADPRPRRR